MALSLIYPEVCALCGQHRAGAREGYVCAPCQSGPGHLRAVAPPYCSRCGLPHAGEVTGPYVCANCADLKLAFEAARAAVVATPFLLDVLHRYKYRGAMWLEPFLGRLLLEGAGPVLRAEEWDGIVPVPLHPLRQRERGFNQAERLARRLAAHSGIPLRTGWVRRVAATETQALLDRRSRAKNVAGAFALTRPISLVGARLLVVDDVLTTGATTSAVSGALRGAGAAAVTVWTLARGV